MFLPFPPPPVHLLLAGKMAALVSLLLVCQGGVISAFGPSFIRVPEPLVLYSNNSGTVIDCLARGEPPPTIDWVNENGKPLNLVPSLAR